jgi:aryl carrier-like protein
MSTRDLIEREMRTVAAEQRRTLRPLADETPLLDCGLDSLCFAILVARLEDILGQDPFAVSEELDFPTTFGAFVALYDRVAG